MECHRVIGKKCNEAVECMVRYVIIICNKEEEVGEQKSRVLVRVNQCHNQKKIPCIQQ